MPRDIDGWRLGLRLASATAEPEKLLADVARHAESDGSAISNKVNSHAEILVPSPIDLKRIEDLKASDEMLGTFEGEIFHTKIVDD